MESSGKTDQHSTTTKAVNPIPTVNFLSWLSFWWLNSLFRTGYKRPLEVDDMFLVQPDDDAEKLTNNLERHWENELKNADAKNKPSLVRTFFRIGFCKLVVCTVVVFFEEGLRVLQPVLIGRLVSYFAPDTDISNLHAFMYGLGIMLSVVLVSLLHHNYFFSIQLLGMRIRVAVCGLIYRKALKLSTGAFSDTNAGQIVNLMSNDVSKFDMATLFLPYIVVAPLQAIAVLVVLWQYIGPSALIGVGALLLFTPIQGLMGKVFARLRIKTAGFTDKRVHLMDEILSGMRIIKMYCWEKPFSSLIADVRRNELAMIWKTRKASLTTTVPAFVARHTYVVSIVIATVFIADLPLNASFLFMLVGLSNNMMWSMTGFVPMAIMFGSTGYASAKRVQAFLLLDERSKKESIDQFTHSSDEKSANGNIVHSNGITASHKSSPHVTLTNATTRWPSQEERSAALSDVSVRVRSGELLAVVGPVGAGKSSLLMSVLGECPATSGEIVTHGKFAFVSQQAWIFSATLRQNILFGEAYDEDKYRRVIELCDLNRDIRLFPYGDLSLVGERGVSLSGGQRARVSLARAVYNDADIYLLDDPLSAVDAAVGKHLFDKCITEHLKDKVVILVTHQLQYLVKATNILVLKDGVAIGKGTYSELSESGVDFTELLKHENVNEQKTVNRQESQTSHQSYNRPAVQRHVSYDYSHGNEEEKENLLIVEDMRLRSNTESGPRHRKKNPMITSSEQLNVADEVLMNNLMVSPQTDADLHMSVQSIASLAFSSQNLHYEKPPLQEKQEEEKKSHGRIAGSVYKDYVLAGGHVIVIILSALLMISGNVSFIMVDWWLSYWSNIEDRYLAHKSYLVSLHTNHSTINITAGNISMLSINATNDNGMTTPAYDDDLPANEEEYAEMRLLHIYILLSLMVALILINIARTLVFFKVCIRASQKLHDRMFQAAVRAKMRFFDTNPIGRILNRFSKDMGLVDDLLPTTAFDFITCLLFTCSIVALSCIVIPWMLLLSAPMFALLIYLRMFYVATSRDIKRLEGTTNSPVYSHLSATLAGLYTVRAYGAQQVITDEFKGHQNQHTEAWFLFLATSRWLAVRLDWLCIVYVSGVVFAGIAIKESMGVSAGNLGLAITYAITVMGMFQWMVRQSAEVENLMTSVERVMEYSALPSEAALEVMDTKPADDWPSQGTVEITGASMYYDEDLPLVLKDVNLSIKPSEKVGIVGRTGAGKSSILTMLFRICEPTGSVLIDQVDVLTLGLHDLRRKISIIPQDPVLFSGTVRYNLDPFKLYEDNALWEALRQVELYPTVHDLPGGLDATVESGGSNFSVGQRQLLCLARAILAKNKILVIDEATANVDTRTDALIQKTIRQEFKDCTVLTIAHRLHTIMDSDRVVVMGDGKVLEFDKPDMLLSNEQSELYKLAEQVGADELSKLKSLASQSHLTDKEKTEEI